MFKFIFQKPRQKTFLNLLLTVGLILAAVFIFSLPVLAQTNELTEVGQAAGLGQTELPILIGRIIRIVLSILGIVAVGLIIYAGIVWMTAQGDPLKIDRARKIIIGAVIGLVIVVSSYAIASFIMNRLSEAAGPDGTITGTGGSGGSLSGLPRCVCPKGDAPYICSISPASGPIGQYVTVWGCRFGEYVEGKSKVRFNTNESVIASCGDKPSWKDTKIVAIVPDGLAVDSFYSVIVTNGNSLESVNSKRFMATAGNPGPGIACVVPDVVKQGEAAEIFGDRFGDSKGESKINIAKVAVESVSAWENKKISVSIPEGAVTGDLKVTVLGTESNGYLVNIKCDLANDCRGSTYCCDGLCDTMICTNVDGSCAAGQACPADYTCCPDKICRKDCNTDGTCVEGTLCPGGYNCCEDKVCRINCQQGVLICNYNGVLDNGEAGIDCGGGGCAPCGSLGTTCYAAPNTCGTDDLCQISTGQCKGEESECRCCCEDNNGCPVGLDCDQSKVCGGKVHGLCCGCQEASQCNNNETCTGGCCRTCQGETNGTSCKGGVCCSGLCCPGDCQDGVCIPFCGNGKIDAGEDCDGVDLNNRTCESLGYVSGTLNCSPACVFDKGGCVGPESGGLGDLCQNTQIGGCTSGAADCLAGGTSISCVQNSKSAPCACCCQPRQGLVPDSCGNSSKPGCNLVCDTAKPCGKSGQRGICCGCTRDDCCNNGEGQICVDNCCYPFPAPTDLIVTGANINQIGLKWKDNSDYETGFEIYRGADGEIWNLIAETESNISVYVDSSDANGVEPGNFTKDAKYYYRVRAKR